MSFHIYGVGTASPPCSISQEHAVALARAYGCTTEEHQRQLKALYRLTRVKTRHSVVLDSDSRDGIPRQSFFPAMQNSEDRGPTTTERMARYEKEAPPLAARAAGVALAEAGLAPGAVTHVVTVSCTGFAAPNFDVGLIRDLGLNWTVARTHVGFMGCHGALNGLRVAKAYADSIPDARVLVCAVELCSLHYQYGWNGDRLVANAIFADGAAAIVGGGRPRAQEDEWVLSANGASLLEDSAELMAWRIGNHGFEMSLSARVPGVIERELRPWLDGWLAAEGTAVDQIASWAVHPGGPRILEACARTIGLQRNDYAVSQEVLGEFGNMSSPTILFILDRLRRRHAPRPCLAIGFGPGLAVEAALFR
ncbi:MAG: type III polyketide synthase [Acidobacteria bacterium]|nr:type III polyketide synthase [Acidobacteriota bacterium]